MISHIIHTYIHTEERRRKTNYKCFLIKIETIMTIY
jgi:hypothetical protein